MAKIEGWDKPTSPWHDGERKLHATTGREADLEKIGRMFLRPEMPDQHREFFNQLPFMIVGSVDKQNRPWASAVFGKPGFITSPDSRSLDFATSPILGDPFSENLNTHSPISLLGIEPPTRRRNRLNAIVSSVNKSGFSVRAIQSFGNCPKYIQTRDIKFVRDPDAPFTAEKESFSGFDDTLRNFISRADTLFVASHNPQDDENDTGGVDVNHRGGMPGFIHIEKNTLIIPDYRGNNFFNTLGNFVLNPKAGLLFIDFETGDLIQMTGQTELMLDLSDSQKEELSAERAWCFKLDHGQILKKASPIIWTFGEYSPKNPQMRSVTGGVPSQPAKSK